MVSKPSLQTRSAAMILGTEKSFGLLSGHLRSRIYSNTESYLLIARWKALLKLERSTNVIRLHLYVR